MSDLRERHQHLMDRFLEFFGELVEKDKQIESLQSENHNLRVQAERVAANLKTEREAANERIAGLKAELDTAYTRGYEEGLSKL